MNICKRILLLFLLCVVLFAQYSPLHTVYATSSLNLDSGISILSLDDDDISNGLVRINSQIYYKDSTGYHDAGGSFSIPTSDLINQVGQTSNLPTSGLVDEFYHQLTFIKNDGSVILGKDESITIEMTNVINRLFASKTGSIATYFGPRAQPYKINFFIIDENEKYHGWAVEPSEINVTGGKIKFNFNITNNIKDGYKIIVRYHYTIADFFGGVPNGGSLNNSNYQIFFKHGFDNSGFTFTVDDGTKGLLNSIIQLVTNIKDGVANLPSKIASSIKGFFDNVVNAVVNLGTTILDGIKNLFVPSEEDITVMKDRWNTLLSDRFGALYQTTELIHDYASAFTEQQKNTITMPSVTIPLAGSEFVFGGWEVQVVPEGFGVVFDTLKLIISVVCTIWFVNGLKNRFERLVGGADNI